MKKNDFQFILAIAIMLFLPVYAGAADLDLPATLNGPYTSDGLISNSGTSTVNSGSIALCATPEKITLLPGFKAETGSIFRAQIVNLTSLTANSDDDSDSIPDWWEYALYGEMDESHDKDQDGASDNLEWTLGSDPIDSNSTPAPGNYYEYDAIGRIKSIIRVK